MYKRRKGFTLIELLAVIIILAIVALIATPIILDVVDDARISAGRSEANMILGGINNYCASEDMKYQLNNSYKKICTTSMNADNVKEMVNLGNAEIKEIAYDGKKLTELVIESNNHKFTLCPSGTFAMDNEKCDGEVGVITTGQIKDVVTSNFPELELGENGCKNPTDNNYSYMNGCYIKGNPTNNYIWYSGFLWRIMGINEDGSVRLITEDNVTSISLGAYDTPLNWEESYAKDWLNNYFYSRLKGNNIIKESMWCSEATTSSSSARTECTTNLSTQTAYVGLMTIDEYNLAGGGSSYLNIDQQQWTMTPYTSSSKAWFASYRASFDYISNTLALRAVINVNYDITITGGNGTIGEIWSSEVGPYILNEDKSVKITGKLNEKAISGEYVMFAGKKYRVVDKDSSGNIKLILDGYYEETEGTTYKMAYGLDNIFSTSAGIGQKLNTDVLNWLVPESDTTNRNKLVSNYTWYQNNFASGQSYTVSLNEESPTRSIQATVGLIRVGEMLSGQSSSILTKGYTITSSSNNANSYWTMTSTTNSSNAWIMDRRFAIRHSVSVENGIRAVIAVNSDVTITGGNGTWSSPYEI